MCCINDKGHWIALQGKPFLLNVAEFYWGTHQPVLKRCQIIQDGKFALIINLPDWIITVTTCY